MSAEPYGSYDLIRRLATGGMAQIFLARPRGMEGFKGYLVVKRILPHLAENEDFVRMFLDEARIAARLNHPNIVQIYDLGSQDDTYFIAMEHIPGEDLRRVTRRADKMGMPLPVPIVCRIIIEACEGLDYAHRKTDPNGRPLGIVHRDISPQNIVLTFSGGVKVVDFGIAQAVDQATVTKSGVLKGKYSYMSPEQASAKPVDNRSDIFALGVVLYELLTGTRLFKRANDIQTLNAVIACQVPPPSEVNTGLSRELDAIVLKALAKQPQNRYAHASQLGAALAKWLEAVGVSATKEDLAQYMQTLYADRLAQEQQEGTSEEMDSAASRNRSRSRSRSRSQVEPDEHDREATTAEPPALPPFPVGKHARDRAQYQPWDDPPSTTPPPAPRGWNPDERTRTRMPTRAAENPGAPAPPPTGRRARAGRLFRRLSRATWRWRQLLLVVGLGVFAAIAVRELRRGGGAARPSNTPEATPAEERVLVASEPPGAEVWIDGARLPGTTPVPLPKLSAGSHVLELKKKGHVATRVAFQVPVSGSWSLPVLRLEPKDPSAMPTALVVAVEVQSQPSGAELSVNGVGQGRTPQTFQAAPRSMLALHLEYPGFAPVDRKIRVGDEQRQSEWVALTPLEGTLGKVRFGVIAGAQIACGKLNFGKSPVPEQSLPPGTYECKFTHPQLGIQTRRFVVRAGDTVHVAVKF